MAAIAVWKKIVSIGHSQPDLLTSATAILSYQTRPDTQLAGLTEGPTDCLT